MWVSIVTSEARARAAIDCWTKFEPYRCSRKIPTFLAKVTAAYEQFHGSSRADARQMGSAETIALRMYRRLTNGWVADVRSACGSRWHPPQIARPLRGINLSDE
jgi:hypothetical protein